MLNEVRIFEFCFYSYLNSNAGNSIFVCKSALVHSDAGRRSHVTKVSGQEEGWVLPQLSLSDAIKTNWRHPQGVIDR